MPPGAPPPHVVSLVQVEPAAHVSFFPPLHTIVQAPPLPHVSEQPVLPLQSTVHPPFGHSTLHVLLPWQVSVDEVSSVTVHLLPPPHVTLLFVPVESLHSLVPLQVEVQFDSQLPSQVDCPAQLVVQPVPHVESHVFFDSHENVALSGGAAPPSTPASPPAPLAPPNVQVPPCLQVHWAPVQTQSPVHEGLDTGALSSPPQPTGAANETAMTAKPNVLAKTKRGFSMGFLRGRCSQVQTSFAR